MLTRIFLAGLLSASLGACMSHSPQSPGVLTDTGAANITALKTALSEAVGRANIKLGAGDLDTATRVTVLPPPRGKYEMNSPAMPLHFEIVTDGADCWLVQQDTRQRFEAPGLSCKSSDAGE